MVKSSVAAYSHVAISEAGLDTAQPKQIAAAASRLWTECLLLAKWHRIATTGSDTRQVSKLQGQLDEIPTKPIACYTDQDIVDKQSWHSHGIKRHIVPPAAGETTACISKLKETVNKVK